MPLCLLSLFAEMATSVAFGAFVGLLVFFGFARFLAGLLYQTSVTDVGVLTTVTNVVVIGALAVAFLQARRLAEVSPIVALRDGTV
jgi:ABC-type antimicrobial peptide transport system permease subunit